MLRFIVSSLVIVTVSAGGYSGGKSYSSAGNARATASYNGAALRAVRVAKSGDNYGSGGLSVGYSSGGNYNGGYAIPASIQTTHNIVYRDVPSSGYIQPATVEVGANAIPVNIYFRSASSILNVQQVHEGSQGTFHESQSEDEPHRLVHQVTKPIFQEVHEIVTPYRRIVQEIKPVQQQVNTIVARGGSKAVLADNTGNFVEQNGALTGTVSSTVLESKGEADAPIFQQIIEQQEINDVGTGDISDIDVSGDNDVSQVQQIVQNKSNDAY